MAVKKDTYIASMRYVNNRIATERKKLQEDINCKALAIAGITEKLQKEIDEMSKRIDSVAGYMNENRERQLKILKEKKTIFDILSDIVYKKVVTCKICATVAPVSWACKQGWGSIMIKEERREFHIQTLSTFYEKICDKCKSKDKIEIYKTIFEKEKF